MRLRQSDEKAIADALAKDFERRTRLSDHPRLRNEPGLRFACPDPYCRVCKDQDGEVCDGFCL